jgi:hypothetical protein
MPPILDDWLEAARIVSEAAQEDVSTLPAKPEGEAADRHNQGSPD